MKIELKTEEDIFEPTKKHVSDAGYDVRIRTIYESKQHGDSELHMMNGEYTLWPGENYKIYLGFRLSMPKGIYSTLNPRSGLFFKSMMNIGIIDSGFQGEVIALVQVKTPTNIKKYDRIGQLLFHKEPEVEFEKVKDKEFVKSDRGEAGIGSTGLK